MKAEEALKDSKFRCGGCGCDLYKIFKHEDKLITVCQNEDCGAESKIIVTQPKIVVDWGDRDQNGVMAVF